jgi:hypothetical protein
MFRIKLEHGCKNLSLAVRIVRKDINSSYNWIPLRHRINICRHRVSICNRISRVSGEVKCKIMHTEIIYASVLLADSLISLMQSSQELSGTVFGGDVQVLAFDPVLRDSALRSRMEFPLLSTLKHAHSLHTIWMLLATPIKLFFLLLPHLYTTATDKQNFFEENVSLRPPICELLILPVKLSHASPLRFLKGRKAGTRIVYEEVVGFTLQLFLLPGGSSPARG